MENAVMTDDDNTVDGNIPAVSLSNTSPSNAHSSSLPIPIPRDHYRDTVTGRIVPSEDLARQAVRTLIAYVGEDPDRDGLKDTPSRVVRALKEMTEGYNQQRIVSPEVILSKVFEQSCDEIIVTKDIPFCSLCEHHMLPYTGTVDIGYLPGLGSAYDRIHSTDPCGPGKYNTIGTRVVGLSKLARLVDYYAKRLTIQERLTGQIANAIMTCLSSQGAAVIVRANHSCLSCRGVKKHDVEMVTSAMLGIFRTKPEARQEFLSLCK